MPNQGQNEPCYTVGQIIGQVTELIESGFPQVLVEGEIKDLTISLRGHWYFTLGDSDGRAAISCVMFAGDARSLSQEFKVGDLVRITANLSIYRERGQFQARTRYMELAGEGALQQAFEELKAKLQKEGLFDEARKRPIPSFPQLITIITSRSGDALQDVVTNIRRRYPPVELTLSHTSVQGETAPAEIESAFEKVRNFSPLPDLIILTRGGGSLFDLAAFNDERVARAIVASPVPVVSAIGHEPDVTIADFVADLRAPTPSTAAEKVTPDWLELYGSFSTYAAILNRQIQSNLQLKAQYINGLSAKLPYPLERLQTARAELQVVGNRLDAYIGTRLTNSESQLQLLTQRRDTAPEGPLAKISSGMQAVQELTHRLVDPAQHLEAKIVELSRLNDALKRSIENFRTENQIHYQSISRRLALSSPRTNIDEQTNQTEGNAERLGAAMRRRYAIANQAFMATVRTLEAVSPLKTIDRGFSVVSKPDGSKWGKPVRSIDEVNIDESLTAHVTDGAIQVKVMDTVKKDA